MAMIEVDEGFLDGLLLKVMPELKKTVQGDKLTFKPNLNLGEGKASDRNLEYRQALLTCLKDTVYDPMNTLLKSDKTVDEKISALDGFIDDYIKEGQILIEDILTKSWNVGVNESETYLKKAAKKQDAKYKAKIPDNPEQLQQIITMGKHNIEDYGLVLRGRLRSAIESESWMSHYASDKA
jgi:hypothetical protein